jgi:hypothetical protein
VSDGRVRGPVHETRRIRVAIRVQMYAHAAIHLTYVERKHMRGSLGIFYPRKSVVCTRSMYFFLADLAESLDLFLFTIQLAATEDERAKITANVILTMDKALVLIKEKEGTVEQIEALRDATLEEIETRGAAVKLGEYATMNSRHLLTSLADSFLTYVSHLIQSVLKKNKCTLKSSETVRIEDLLEFNNNRDLVNFLIDRKINELSYGGMKKIEEYIKDRFGVDIFNDQKSRSLLIIFIELRNIHVHNRGYVNDVFLSRVKDSCGFTFVKNKRYGVNFETLRILANNCGETALRLDEILATKFHLDRKRYANWKNKSPRFI